jgi:hypothetical protein
MNIILRLLCLPCVFVGFGEGVCRIASQVSLVPSNMIFNTVFLSTEFYYSLYVYCHSVSFVVALIVTLSRICRPQGRADCGVWRMPSKEGQQDSPKVLRFSIDINSCVIGELGKSCM